MASFTFFIFLTFLGQAIPGYYTYLETNPAHIDDVRAHIENKPSWRGFAPRFRVNVFPTKNDDDRSEK